MTKYKIELAKAAEKFLDSLSDNIAKQIISGLSKLEENPRPYGYKKLKNRNAFRIRSGDYRIIYEIMKSKLVISVIRISHRKDAYKVN